MTELRRSSDNVADSNPGLEISDPAVFAKIPLVSVKKITYNHELYITQAIEGVLQLEEWQLPLGRNKSIIMRE